MMAGSLKEKPNAEPLPESASAGIILNGRYLPPPEDKDGKIWVRTGALIHAKPEVLYELWRNIKRAPEWQEHITDVSVTGDKTSHWIMRSGDKTLEWDSE